MKGFRVAVPHVVIGLAAMAMTATTMALAVVVPIASACAGHAPRTLAAAPAAANVDILPARIEVVAVRATPTAPRITGAAARPNREG